MNESGGGRAERHPALRFDWDGADLDPLRRMMSRPGAETGVDLETALEVFFNGDPQAYNMIAKPDLPPAAQARCNLLDSIHRRIVCGFYLPQPEAGGGRGMALMRDWIARQETEARDGHVGRWVFEADLLEHDAPPPPRLIATPPAPFLTVLWHSLTGGRARNKPVREAEG